MLVLMLKFRSLALEILCMSMGDYELFCELLFFSLFWSSTQGANYMEGADELVLVMNMEKEKR